MLYRSIPDFLSLLPSSGRLVCLDMGTERIGIAHSDAMRTIASPNSVYARRTISQDLGHMNALATGLQAVGFVIGYPLALSGEETPACETIKRFAEKLSKKNGLPILLWDERFTTAAVTRAMKGDEALSRKDRHERDDQLAAAYLLQGVLG